MVSTLLSMHNICSDKHCIKGTFVCCLSQPAGCSGVPQVPVGQAAHRDQPTGVRQTALHRERTEIRQNQVCVSNAIQSFIYETCVYSHAVSAFVAFQSL